MNHKEFFSKILSFGHRLGGQIEPLSPHLICEIAQKKPFLTQKGLFSETVYSKKQHNINLIYQFSLCSSCAVRLPAYLKSNKL